MQTNFILFLALLIISFSRPTVADDYSRIWLEDLNGNRQALNQYVGQGKWLVLNIWAPGCLPCRLEMPELQQFHDRHKHRDAVVLGMAVSFPDLGQANADEVRSFIESHNISFPVLLGSGNSLTLPYNSRLAGLPTTILFNPEGDMIAAKLGRVSQKMIEDFIKKAE